jgi:hypothetical protein
MPSAINDIPINNELDELLIQLALKNQEIRQREGQQ